MLESKLENNYLNELRNAASIPLSEKYKGWDL